MSLKVLIATWKLPSKKLILCQILILREEYRLDMNDMLKKIPKKYTFLQTCGPLIFSRAL